MTDHAVFQLCDGLIVNRVVLNDPAEWTVPGGCGIAAESTVAYEIGGTFVDGVYTPPPAAPGSPPPLPGPISDRQFFQQLAVLGVITPDDALAAVKTGVLPEALQQLVSAMPRDQQFGATMMIAGATAFERNHPLTIAIGTAYGLTAAEIDALWRAAAVL